MRLQVCGLYVRLNKGKEAVAEAGGEPNERRSVGLLGCGHDVAAARHCQHCEIINDPTVGCVSSVDQFVDAQGNLSGEGAYVKYEMLLRRLETKVNTLVGLSGSFFAARKTVCSPWADDLQSDFNTLLNSMKAGLRGVSDPGSVGYYKNLTDEEEGIQRKVRTVLRGIAVLMRSLRMLNPFQYGLFAWQLFSHECVGGLCPLP